MKTTTRSFAVFGLTALLAASCTMKNQEAPPLTGPSEFGTSVTVQVTPDVLQLDGASQAVVTVTVFDSAGKPMANVPLRADIIVNGFVNDFGSLSARSLVTGADGRAMLVYTAPAVNADSEALVDISVTPLGNNFQNAVARTATIRLVPTGIRLPPSDLVPAFEFSPPAPTQSQNVLFNAQASRGTVAQYRWDFGDGTTGTGQTTTHAYRSPGTYFARLTLVDPAGRSASTLRSITVGQGTAPTASAVFSPSAPLPGQTVNFNAAASTAAAGRSIVKYEWSFGDGTSASGMQVSHAYSTPGTYAVTLVVTDDIGRTGTTTVSVPVGAAAPVANFVFSPTSPAAGQQVNFNATSSTAPAGRTITGYRWDFGDGTIGTGAEPNHAYVAPGTYNVTLTVTDSAGATSTRTSSITVTSGQPTADFTFSPTDPAPGATVFFNGAASRGAAGRSIVSYAWSFGDGTTATGVNPTKTGGYANPGTYAVTLTVTDDRGNTGVTSRTVAVK